MEPTNSLGKRLDALLSSLNWHVALLCLFGSLSGMLETMTIDSTFAYGYPAVGPLCCFIVMLIALGIVCTLPLAKQDRHRYVSRTAVGATLFAIFALFMLANAVSQSKSRGHDTTKLAFTPTLIVLGVQLAAALVYLSYAHPLPPADEPPIQIP